MTADEETKETWSIVFHSHSAGCWDTIGKYETPGAAGFICASLVVHMADGLQPIVVETWRAPALEAVLNSTKEDLGRVKELL